MFENVLRMNLQFGSPFRDETDRLNKGKEMLLAQQDWIVSELAEAVDDRLIAFERGKHFARQEEWDLALVTNNIFAFSTFPFTIRPLGTGKFL